ncbi:interferon alpha/beta receptor 1-like [Xenopus laevis]|nr:interferon alpha/beta receptor 1-like [Xenopus laevis]
MSSTEHEYENNIARVKAKTANESSKWEKSQRFHPVFDATIGPPAVTLKTHHTSILLNITIPWEVQQSKYLIDSVNKNHFIITVSHKDLEMPIIEITTNNIWNISNLTPWSQYCLSVLMNFPEIKKTSLSSSEQCVILKGVEAKGLITGSLVAAIVAFIVACFLGIYVALNRYVLNPKTRLPSNLILQGLNSNEIIHIGDKHIFMSSEYENTELDKYTLETKESDQESPLCKRYISMEPCRNYYVNCMQSELHHSSDKAFQLRNPSYISNATERYSVKSHMFQYLNSFQKTPKICRYSNLKENTTENVNYVISSEQKNISTAYIIQDKAFKMP